MNTWKQKRGQKNYTRDDMLKIYQLFKQGKSIDDIHSEFPDRNRESIRYKMNMMGLTKS